MTQKPKKRRAQHREATEIHQLSAHEVNTVSNAILRLVAHDFGDADPAMVLGGMLAAAAIMARMTEAEHASVINVLRKFLDAPLTAIRPAGGTPSA